MTLNIHKPKSVGSDTVNWFDSLLVTDGKSSLIVLLIIALLRMDPAIEMPITEEFICVLLDSLPRGEYTSQSQVSGNTAEEIILKDITYPQ